MTYIQSYSVQVYMLKQIIINKHETAVLPHCQEEQPLMAYHIVLRLVVASAQSCYVDHVFRLSLLQLIAALPLYSHLIHSVRHVTRRVSILAELRT